MHKTPLPEIPEYLYDEDTLELYWEVSYNSTGHHQFAYVLILKKKYKFTTPARTAKQWVDNPKKRWWNNQPIQILEEYEIPEEYGESETYVTFVDLSSHLDFTAEDIYRAAEKILQNLEKEGETRKLLGKYPPKTLNLDPATI